MTDAIDRAKLGEGVASRRRAAPQVPIAPRAANHTPSMVERVARALCLTTFSDPDALILVDPDGPDRSFVPLWKEYVPEARIAIKAMRAPTEAMIDAGHENVIAPAYVDATMCDPETVWAAMIDAALKEGE
jgi:hypothetical protein